MTRIFFRYGWKICCLKYTISKFDHVCLGLKRKILWALEVGPFWCYKWSGAGSSSLRMWRLVGTKHEIVVDIEGFQMRREMSSDSEGSYISELSDSDHEERKVEEETSFRIASSVCGTNVTSKLKSRGILTARFQYHFLGQNGSTSSAYKAFKRGRVEGL